MSLTQEQYDQLLRPLNPRRVGKVKTDRGEMSHVEAYEIRAHLNRLFGFLNWSAEVLSQELVFEEEAKTKAGKDAWRVCYRTTLRLTVMTPGGLAAAYTEGATGDALIPQRAEAHDMALKTSQSQALKRCAANLGDQFGLSLYNKGSLAPLVGRSLITPTRAAVEGDVTDHITAPLAPENEAPESPQREVSSPPSQPAPAAAQEPARVAPPAAAVPTVCGAPSPFEGEDYVPPCQRPAPHAGVHMADRVPGEPWQWPQSEEPVPTTATASTGGSTTSETGGPQSTVEESAPAESPTATSEPAARVDPMLSGIAATVGAIVDAQSADEPDELAAAVAAAEAAFPGASVEPDPFDWCLEQIAAATRLAPTQARQKLTEVMTVAVRRQLLGRRMPDSDVTLGARLTKLVAFATAAERDQKAKAASS